jgi:hypothetical protein
VARSKAVNFIYRFLIGKFFGHYHLCVHCSGFGC